MIIQWKTLKKNKKPESADKDDDEDADFEEGDAEEGEGDNDDEDSDNSEEEEKKKQLTRTNVRKVAKFVSDLKSMMESVLDEAEDNTLPIIEKTTCQELLLQISINEKLFNEQQRHYARSMLKRLEGDRRRRCRTSEQPRFTPGRSRRGDDENTGDVIPEELRIVSTKKVRRKRRTKAEMEADRQSELLKKKKRNGNDGLDEDGYKRHSDSEGDWSDVGEDVLNGNKKNGISQKEAQRRRPWAADDDSATAAGRPWPVFPRSVVAKVLKTVLEEVTRYDDSKGGVFSVPVPRDDFPEYYEQIKKPMDYGTMKEKLDRGEYRSAQGMQKDFILVMQNCLQFNSANSDIVKDARQQALMRPSILRKAAAEHNLFLAEDGSVLEIVNDEKEAKGGEKKKRRRRKGGQGEDGEESEPPKKVSLAMRLESFCFEECSADVSLFHLIFQRKKKTSEKDETNAGDKSKKRKPRIQISIGKGKDDDAEAGEKVKKRRRRKKVAEEGVDGGEQPEEKRKRRKQKTGASEEKEGKSSKKASQSVDSDDDSQDDKPIKSLKASESKTSSDKDGSDTNSATSAEKDDSKEINGVSGLIFMDVQHWKDERGNLDGSFMAARASFTKHGHWNLPDVTTERKFRLIAKSLLVKMDR